MNIDEQHIPYFDFLVAPLSGEQAKEILEKVDQGVINYLKFMDGNQSPLIVNKGSTLFTFNPPLEGIEESEQASADDLLTHTIEDTDSLTKEDNNYIANNDGILLIHENLIKFISVKYDGYCTIEISDDKTAVIANIYAASGDGKQLSVDDVVKVIKKNNISVSLDKFEIKRALDKVNKDGESISKIIIAKAKPPIPGKEAWALFPEQRYAKVPGTYFVPTGACLANWLSRAGFTETKIFYSHPMSSREQRRTEWMVFESYEDFIDKTDPSLTMEGYPAPIRIFARAENAL